MYLLHAEEFTLLIHRVILFWIEWIDLLMSGNARALWQKFFRYERYEFAHEW